MALLREGLLAGRAIATAGVSGPVRDALLRLGARVEPLAPEPGFGEDEERVGEWARGREPLHGLVYAAREGEATDAVWSAVREVAVGALIPGAEPGKVVLIAPRPGSAGRDALAAALESLARTLAVEWARYGITAVAIVPGEATDEERLAELVCFLCSAAGEYLSGCRLEVGELAMERP